MARCIIPGDVVTGKREFPRLPRNLISTRLLLGYFRKLSGKLNPDGTWTSEQQQTAAQAGLNDPKLKKKLQSDRISSVALAYKIMKLDQSRALVKCCNILDSTLYATPTIVVGDIRVCDLGDRIQFGRHAAGHGHWGDISAEAVLYSLMTAIVFYNQT